jgi:hypothetical protein
MSHDERPGETSMEAGDRIRLVLTPDHPSPIESLHSFHAGGKSRLNRTKAER